MAESHVQTLQTKEAPSRAEISPDADWLAGVALRCGAGIGAGAVLFGVLRWNDVAPDHAFVSALVLALSICFRWETALAGSVVFGTLLKASSEPLQRFTEILSNGTKIARFYNAVDQAGYLEFIALVFLLVFPVYGIIYCARTILGSFRLVERRLSRESDLRRYDSHRCAGNRALCSRGKGRPAPSARNRGRENE